MSEDDFDAERAEILQMLRDDRVLAHEFLFSHRHPDPSPPFHRQMILDWHSDEPYVLDEAFRGGAKSTIAEEAICIRALFGEFKNAVVLGENETRAVERLTSVKTELENNDKILEIFGPQQGPIWGERKIKLLNGTFLQALGRDQSMRGVKHETHRPDVLFIDDYEDEESVATPDARAKVWRRFWAVVIPALDRHHRVRVAGTPLDNAAFIVRLRKLRGWRARRFPIEYVDEKGVRRATWEARFPLSWIDDKKETMIEAGESATWEREYMLNAIDEKTKPFIMTDARVENVQRTWEPTYAIYDPARTTKEATSAHTGIVVASWMRSRIVVWESRGVFHKPDETIDDMFDVNARYNPVAVGVEVNGLEEYLMQPIRKAQMERKILLPLRELRAPRASTKDDFIKGLQPFWKAHEIIIVGEQPQLLEQFDAFPRGRKDILNALAYIQRIRTGIPVYRAFALGNVDMSEAKLMQQTQSYLAVNAGVGYTTAALVQLTEDGIIVLADWVHDAPAGEVMKWVLRQVATEFQPAANWRPKIVAPEYHWSTHNQLGLVAAVGQTQQSVFKGGSIPKGREEIRSNVVRITGGLKVNLRASWCMRGFTDGFAYPLTKTGTAEDEPADNVYRTLIEGIEALAGLSRVFTTDDNRPNMAYTADGRAYISARANTR